MRDDLPEQLALEQLAHVAADHALLLFGAGLVLLLSCAGLFWHLLQRHGDALWRAAGRLWVRLDASPLLSRLPWLDRWLARGLSPGRYLLLHLAAGFAMVLAAGLAFFEIADEIRPGEDLAVFDAAFSERLRQSLAPEILRGFYAVTRLGDVATLALLSTLVALLLILRRHWLLAAGWIVATAGNGLLVRLLKQLFHRDRPLHDDHGLFLAHGWSFPSGHAAGSMAVYGMLAYLLLRLAPAPLRLPGMTLMAALVLLVGSSRVFLRAHYLSDVLAGYLLALAWLAVCIAGTEMALRHAQRGRLSDAPPPRAGPDR